MGFDCPFANDQRVGDLLIGLALRDQRRHRALALGQTTELFRLRAVRGRRAFLGDGQKYNWTIRKGYFPDFEAIADLLHVLCYLYLGAWATSLEEGERWGRYESWLRACWQGRVAAVLEELRHWQERLGKPPKGEVDEYDPRQLVAAALVYLGHNTPRMDYPRYRSKGWQIGSGPVESACKTVVGQRLKRAGMRWGEDGADALCHLRALYRSAKGQWEAFWNRDFSPN